VRMEVSMRPVALRPGGQAGSAQCRNLGNRPSGNRPSVSISSSPALSTCQASAPFVSASSGAVYGL
jgi:hypothetical protein